MLTDVGSKYFKYISSILSVCCFGLVIAIVVLDTQSSTAYTYAEKFSGEALFGTWHSYYRSILGLIVGFIILFFFVQCLCLYFTYSFKDMPNLPLRYLEYIIFEFLIVLIVLLAHDSVIVNFLQCLNAIRRGVMNAKAICTIVLMVLIFIRILLHFLISHMESEKSTKQKTITTIIFTFYTLTIMAIIGLNIAILVMVNKNIKIWNRGDIGIGLYHRSEIPLLRNGTLNMTNTIYDTYYLTSLDDLFTTKEEMTMTARNLNDSSQFITHSLIRYAKVDQYRRLLIDIDCFSPLYPYEIFGDCNPKSDSSIRFILQYDEKKKRFPVYNCATINETFCAIGCPWFELSNYKFMMISVQSGDMARLAWDGISSCDVISENSVNLDLSLLLDICSLNTARQPTYNILLLVISLALFTLFM